MADQNINYKITVDVESGTASLRDLQGRIVANQVPLQELRKEFGNLEKTVNAADFNKFKQGLDTISKSNINLKTSTGAATSATLELGRAISDAPYGIRGVANNLSQFASQFSFMANTVDQATGKVVGFSGAMKNLGRAMKANAILLVIQTIISALDYFAGGAEKAQKANESLTKSFDDLISKLGDLEGKLPDAIAGLFERLGLSNKEFDEFALNMAETLKLLNNEFPEFKNAYDRLSETQKNDPKQIANIIEKYRELINTRKEIAKQEELLKKLNLANGEYAESNLQRNREIYKQLILQKIGLEEIFKTIKKGRSKQPETIPTFKTKEELDLDIKNQEDALLEFEKKIKLQAFKNQELEELASAKTEKQKSEIKRRYSQLNLEVELNNEEKRLILAQSNERQVAKDKHDNHVDELKRIFEEYKLKVELNDKLTTQQKQSAISDAKSKTDESIAQAGSELIKTNKEIDDSYNPLFKMFEELAKKRRDALGIVSEDKKTEEFDALSSYIESYKTLMGGVTEFINGEYERQLTIEQNKTNALNAELNNRLLNENLSKDERARIQNEIAQNDEALRIKQNEIAKKQFNTQKAFNIAMAVADTYLAGVKVLADPSFIGRPWARGIAMAATIASGLASVAAIARQKFQPSAANTPVRTSGSGGSGGGMADRSFNFNLVGNNAENQLANAIQSQFNQPLKAYVVSRDMSNQQQLDANIVNSARF
jgi:hypothetical protein